MPSPRNSCYVLISLRCLAPIVVGGVERPLATVVANLFHCDTRAEVEAQCAINAEWADEDHQLSQQLFHAYFIAIPTRYVQTSPRGHELATVVMHLFHCDTGWGRAWALAGVVSQQLLRTYFIAICAPTSSATARSSADNCCSTLISLRWPRCNEPYS